MNRRLPAQVCIKDPTDLELRTSNKELRKSRVCYNCVCFGERIGGNGRIRTVYRDLERDCSREE